jgi:hypothetical protein
MNTVMDKKGILGLIVFLVFFSTILSVLIFRSCNNSANMRGQKLNDGIANKPVNSAQSLSASIEAEAPQAPLSYFYLQKEGKINRSFGKDDYCFSVIKIDGCQYIVFRQSLIIHKENCENPWHKEKR